MKKRLFVLLMSLFFCGFYTALAQDALNVQVRRSEAKPFSDRVGYTVSLYVSVTDNSGKPLRGLSGEHFKVFEDSLPQILTESRSAEDEPVSVVLLADLSGSMLGQDLYNP